MQRIIPVFPKRLGYSMCIACCAILLFSCQKNDQLLIKDSISKGLSQNLNNGWTSPDLVMAWNLEIQKAYTFPVNVGVSPPLVSRLFAMYHVAMHDALNCIKPKFETYAYHQVDKDADPDAAVSQAVYEVLKVVGPQGAGFAPFENLLAGSLAAIPDGDAKTKGIALGKAVAQAVLAKRSADIPYIPMVGFNPTPASGVNPGEFSYFPPLNTYALAGFHLQQPWIIKTASQFLPGPPYPVNSAAYAADYNEVKTLGQLNSTIRTPEQKAIGYFWAENSSRGWNSVARDILAQRPANSMDAWKTARLLALLHLAIADGYIAVFDTKMHYYFWRPISAIHSGDNDNNPATVGDPTWQSELATPPVGEYSSAHALTGAAAGEVIIRFFKTSHLPFTTTSGYWPGTRTYDDVKSAIWENALSRIYIGYHFRKAITVGSATGINIGDYIFENGLKEK
ncbi:vanadium-dependent haloperoxidase [Flavihumibacter profundi]|uniref:vanadium-dependent haloperoxidase n=1 Tax=Flavihumibacter profundi TaxID=2716883 RepID=UPI001CC51092|nr:vanadium-dependent haloperoxidase [Flavihumibacter profundi]MBZ5855534.1 phosphatase PAP2 family protein [Flavihumibacter profundi]